MDKNGGTSVNQHRLSDGERSEFQETLYSSCRRGCKVAVPETQHRRYLVTLCLFCHVPAIRTPLDLLYVPATKTLAQTDR